MYNEFKPRLAVSGWFHAARASEMGDWPEHPRAADGEHDAGSNDDKAGAAVSGTGDDAPPDPFKDDFLGEEVREEARGEMAETGSRTAACWLWAQQHSLRPTTTCHLGATAPVQESVSRISPDGAVPSLCLVRVWSS